jgi:hypothetical protein
MHTRLLTALFTTVTAAVLAGAAPTLRQSGRFTITTTQTDVPPPPPIQLNSPPPCSQKTTSETRLYTDHDGLRRVLEGCSRAEVKSLAIHYRPVARFVAENLKEFGMNLSLFVRRIVAEGNFDAVLGVMEASGSDSRHVMALADGYARSLGRAEFVKSLESVKTL